MKLVTVSGPPSSGKTSVILRTAEFLKKEGLKVGVIKFDCLSTYDDRRYQKSGIPVIVGLSGNLCPDHFFISNIEDCLSWGERNKFDILISESAGLCNRCSPHIKGVKAVCVIDSLSGVNTPKKIGPMLKLADIAVITKGDIISQAEREVFCFNVKQASPKAGIIFVNGISGQGAFDLSVKLRESADTPNLSNRRIRFTMPMALCPYCLGETMIGVDFQTGNVKKMKFGEVPA